MFTTFEEYTDQILNKLTAMSGGQIDEFVKLMGCPKGKDIKVVALADNPKETFPIKKGNVYTSACLLKSGFYVFAKANQKGDIIAHIHKKSLFKVIKEY